MIIFINGYHKSDGCKIDEQYRKLAREIITMILSSFIHVEMNILMVVGISIILGFIAGFLFKKINIPEAVGMILMGVFLGESVLGFLSYNFIENVKPLIDLALAFIGLGIGTELKFDLIGKLKKSIFFILIFESLGAFALVTLGVFILTHELYIALVFGALAVSTAPAATAKVLWDYGAKGDLTTTIFSIIALDDIVAIIVYAFAFSYAESVVIDGKTVLVEILLSSLLHIAGSIVLGLVTGATMVILFNKIEEITRVLWLIFICVIAISGVAETMGFSLILTNVIAGIIFTNFSNSNEKIFYLIREATYPLVVLFFVLIGGKLRLDYLPHIGLIGLTYLIMRFVGKFSGVAVGGHLSKSSAQIKKYLGFCLLTQGGLAIGLATSFYYNLATLSEVGYHLGTLVLNTIVATTLIVEILGPIFVKYAITKTGEIYKKPPT